MEVLQITKEKIPQGISGEAIFEENELTGCFLEAVAINYLAEVLEIFKEKIADTYLAYMAHLNQMGITTIGDVALTGESWDDLVYPELFQQIEEAATTRAIFYPAMRSEITELTEIAAKYCSPKVQMGGVKQFFDGVTS
jgi:predicted amidohydrolase YtcJ